MIRLITDNFARVINLSPVLAPSDRGSVAAAGCASARIGTYPANVETRVLYERELHEPRLAVAWRHLAALPTIYRTMGEVDVVQLRLPSYPAFLASFLCLLTGKHMLVSIHGNWGAVMRAQRGRDRLGWRVLADLVDRYQRLISRRSVATLVTGEHTRELAGPDAIVFANHQIEERDLYRRDDTCAGERLRLLYVGGLSKNKGTEQLLDAVALLAERGMPCELTLAGRELDYDAAAAIARRGLGSRVRLAGFVSWGASLFELYRSADLFVFPSLSEGVPKAPMEALSQSLPVIATHAASGGYIEHEHSGLLVPAGDGAALAAAIERMAGDRALRRACIARGFAIARESTREHMHARISRALAAVFAAEPRPAGIEAVSLK